MLKSSHSKALDYKNTITSSFLKKHLHVLASDEFEGRETTKKGQKLAATYLKNFLDEKNIKSAYDSTYFQQFPVDVSDFNNVKLFIYNKQLSFIDQFYIQPLIQWNPNPSTIFYLGANQNTLEEIDDTTFSLFQFNRSQIFFKFQYLIGL